MRKYAMLILSIVFFLSGIPVATASAVPTSVSDFQIETPYEAPFAGDWTKYDLTFKPYTDLTVTDTVYVVFPSGFAANEYEVPIDRFDFEIDVDNNGFNRPLSASSTNVNGSLAIAMSFGQVAPAGSAVTIAVRDGAINNPSSPGLYAVELYTSKDTLPALSEFRVYDTTVSDFTLQPGNTQIGAINNHITFKFRTMMPLDAGDTFSLELPMEMGIMLDDPLTPFSVELNGSPATATDPEPHENGTMAFDVLVPDDIPHDTEISIKLYGLINPSEEGVYDDFWIGTSKDSNRAQASLAFTDSNVYGTVSGFTVSTTNPIYSKPDEPETADLTLRFTPNKTLSGSETAIEPQITIYLPSGTALQEQAAEAVTIRDTVSASERHPESLNFSENTLSLYLGDDAELLAGNPHEIQIPVINPEFSMQPGAFLLSTYRERTPAYYELTYSSDRITDLQVMLMPLHEFGNTHLQLLFTTPQKNNRLMLKLPLAMGLPEQPDASHFIINGSPAVNHAEGDFTITSDDTHYLIHLTSHAALETGSMASIIVPNGTGFVNPPRGEYEFAVQIGSAEGTAFVQIWPEPKVELAFQSSENEITVLFDRQLATDHPLHPEGFALIDSQNNHAMPSDVQFGLDGRAILLQMPEQWVPTQNRLFIHANTSTNQHENIRVWTLDQQEELKSRLDRQEDGIAIDDIVHAYHSESLRAYIGGSFNHTFIQWMLSMIETELPVWVPEIYY